MSTNLLNVNSDTNEEERLRKVARQHIWLEEVDFSFPKFIPEGNCEQND